jgi:hypothetical protein
LLEVVEGTHGTVVRGNRIEGHRPAGYREVATLVITDEVATASYTVRNNRFADNTLDILVDSVDTGHTVTHNDCESSEPDGLCN